MTHMNSQLLDATRAWAAENSARIGLHPAASRDLARRLLEIGVLARAEDGSVYPQAGDSLDDLVEILRGDPSAQYLFYAPVPLPTPMSSQPDFASMDATSRLAFANGGNAKASL